MKKNIGTKDRIARLILGIILIILAFFTANISIKILLSVIAIVAIFQAAVSWCVLYSLLGKNTCPISKS
jgi:uncharacterized membrane protein HdeD (DUF308 family)